MHKRIEEIKAAERRTIVEKEIKEALEKVQNQNKKLDRVRNEWPQKSIDIDFKVEITRGEKVNFLFTSKQIREYLFRNKKLVKVDGFSSRKLLDLRADDKNLHWFTVNPNGSCRIYEPTKDMQGLGKDVIPDENVAKTP